MIPQPVGPGNMPGNHSLPRTPRERRTCSFLSAFSSLNRAIVTSLLSGPASALIVAVADSAGVCPGRHPFVLRFRRNPRVLKPAWLDCRRWKCTACGPRKLADWLSHLAGMIAASSEGGELCFLGREGDGADWRTQTQAFRRAGADYARIAVENAQPVVIATVAFPGSVAVEPAEAVEAVAAALLAAPVDGSGPRKRVTTSRFWSRHKRDQSPFMAAYCIPRELAAEVERAIAANDR